MATGTIQRQEKEQPGQSRKAASTALNTKVLLWHFCASWRQANECLFTLLPSVVPGGWSAFLPSGGEEAMPFHLSIQGLL